MKFSTKKVFSKKQPKTGQNGQKIGQNGRIRMSDPFQNNRGEILYKKGFCQKKQPKTNQMAKKMATTAELECRTPFKITVVKFSTKKVFAKKQPKNSQNGRITMSDPF